MAKMIIQHTDTLNDCDVNVFDDDTVYHVGGDLIPEAVVTHNEDGSVTVDVHGDGVTVINPPEEVVH